MQPGTSPPKFQDPAAPDASGAARNPVAPRAPYAPPVLERLGPWEAFTLQMSIPIFP
jgi:hypothetical protein